MAEAILSDITTKILEGLGSPLVQEIGLASGVKKELRKLEESLSRIKAILSDAEKESAMNDVIKDWLRRLKDVAYDAEDVLDEFATKALRQQVELPKKVVVKQVRKCFSRSNPLIFRLVMAHRIKDIIERLDCIQNKDELARFEFQTQSVALNIGDDDDSRHTDPFVIESEVLGRERDKEILVRELLTSLGGNSQDHNVMVIPIIGIGGLGKTTLAGYVYNDERVKKHFDLRMWVCVSFGFDVVHLVKKILESITNKLCDDHLGENQAKSQLLEKLSGKRYLLVLDDVWNDHPGKWENLRRLLIGTASGSSMILVTTRSQEVASIMHPIKVVYPLQGLNENDCESLFNERAFGKGNEANHPKLVKIGKAIVKKCGGVPLAAKALGSLLHIKRNKKDWLDVLNTEIWNLEGEREILPALKISYNHLPSHLKQCFAYCSLFPQDHKINVDDLIHQWMAHGFIPPPPHRSSSLGSTSDGGGITIEDIGNRYFRELLWRSFFQEVKEDEFGNISTCKMHDLVHNLARWVAGMEWAEVKDSSRKGVRHMIMTVTNPPLSSFEKKDLIKLRTLYLQHLQGNQNHDELGIINNIGFVSSLRGLRVLNLTNLRMRHVPSSIRYLKQLRYLDLSKNPFEALPNSICKLYNLQTLRLNYCHKFEEWPRDMTKMVSLRHLELDYYCQSMKYMPRGLGQLSTLQTLTTFAVGDSDTTTLLMREKRSFKMGGLGELHALNQLRGELCIRWLGNVRDATDAKEAKLKDKSELQSLKLDFRRNGGRRLLYDQLLLLGNLQPHPNLKRLIIWDYEGVKMPHWMIRSSSLLPNLVQLEISMCYKLECLPLIGEFPCLKRLQLFHLHSLESICNEVVVSVSGGRGRGAQLRDKPLVLFPLLEQLELGDVPSLERWTINPSVEATMTLLSSSDSDEEEEEESVVEEHNHLHFLSSMFPRLTYLTLFDCPKLATVPMLSVGGIQHLTSLRILELSHLERLVSLPDCPAPATLEELRILNCTSLVRLPNRFFQNLYLLSIFNINKCSEELTSLPESIPHLKALKELHITNCQGLTTLPEGLGNLASLQELVIQDCSNLSSLPQGIQHLTALETLTIDDCPGLRALPDGLGNLASLQELKIHDCSNLSSLPQGIQHLPALKEQNIYLCPGLRVLPDGLGSLTSLQKLDVQYCRNLSSLPQGIQHLPVLKELNIFTCPGLIALPDGLGSLTSLQALRIDDCPNLLSLPKTIQHLTALKVLSIQGCSSLNTLPEDLGSLTALERLSILKLDGINQLPESFGNLICLKKLEIWDCSNLSSLPKGIQHLTALEELRIQRCPGLETLPEGLGSLSSLEIWDCSNLSSLPKGIQHLTALKELRIQTCPGLETLPEGLGSLSSLEKLEIWDCSNLSSLPKGIQHLTALKKLRIQRCPGLETLPEGLGSLSSLEKLEIWDCSNLSSLPKGIQHLTALKKLRIERCPGLKTLPEGLGSLSSLQKLVIQDCSNLLSLPKGIQHLTALGGLRIYYCPSLRALPNGPRNLSSRGLLRISDSLPRHFRRSRHKDLESSDSSCY